MVFQISFGKFWLHFCQVLPSTCWFLPSPAQEKVSPARKASPAPARKVSPAPKPRPVKWSRWDLLFGGPTFAASVAKHLSGLWWKRDACGWRCVAPKHFLAVACLIRLNNGFQLEISVVIILRCCCLRCSTQTLTIHQIQQRQLLFSQRLIRR